LIVSPNAGALDASSLLHVRAQLPRCGIDDLELFLDADGEGVFHGRLS